MSVFALDCERDDIDHYLDRGFSPQQVLELCRPQGAMGETQQSVGEELSLQKQLAKLIDATRLNLTEETLSFERQICVKYDEPNFAQQQKKACGTAEFKVPRLNLQVLDQRKKLLFWGTDAVIIKAPGLERRYELGQADLSERDKKQLSRALPQDDELSVPVRSGASAADLADLLRQISQTKKTAP